MNIAMELVMSDATLEALERLRPIAERAGVGLTEMALAWVLRREEVASAIVGASPTAPRRSTKLRAGSEAGSRRRRELE